MTIHNANGGIVIDGHQHFWRLDRGEYAWLSDQRPVIYQDFLPANLAPQLQSCSVSGTVLVQAVPSVAETEFLLGLTREASFVKGVVGWVDLASSDCAAFIARLDRHPKAVGVRAMLQPLADSQWLSGAAVNSGLRTLESSTLVLDVLMTPDHLNVVNRVLSNYPALNSVINHAAKPNFRAPLEQHWKQGMIKLAAQQQVFCKISGMTATVNSPAAEIRLKEAFDFVFDTFGPERIVWGSDWPVMLETSSYRRWFDITAHWLDGLAMSDRAEIMGGTACRVYDI